MSNNNAFTLPEVATLNLNDNSLNKAKFCRTFNGATITKAEVNHTLDKKLPMLDLFVALATNTNELIPARMTLCIIGEKQMADVHNAIEAVSRGIYGISEQLEGKRTPTVNVNGAVTAESVMEAVADWLNSHIGDKITFTREDGGDQKEKDPITGLVKKDAAGNDVLKTVTRKDGTTFVPYYVNFRFAQTRMSDNDYDFA